MLDRDRLFATLRNRVNALAATPKFARFLPAFYGGTSAEFMAELTQLAATDHPAFSLDDWRLNLRGAVG
ncbi:MAG TPA: hypothetical protein VIH75_15880 [Candidatus Sulfotelmatobacter sp.]